MPLPLLLAPLALKLAPVGRILKAIPRPVWIALAVALVLFLGWRWHVGTVKDARNEGYAAGVAYEGQRIADKARGLKKRADDIAATIRSKTDETNRRIAGDADALRVSGAGKAACPGAIPSRPGGQQPTAGQTGLAVDQVSNGAGIDLIALPFAGTIAVAEQHDLCRSDLTAWREWHRKLSEMK